MITGGTSMAALAWWWPVVELSAPGPAGLVGGLLIAGGLAALGWLWWSGRRADRERRAEVAPVFTPGRVPAPAARPVRRGAEQATQLIARTGDSFDATVVYPAVRGGRRG